MGLFLAIYPPREYQDYFRDVLRRFFKEKRNIIPVPVDQMHVTVRFIGSKVSDESRDRLYEELKLHEGNFGKALLTLKKVQLGFPYQRDPKIIHIGIESNDSMNGVTNFAHQVIKELKLYDTITWKVHQKNEYHISLARLKKTASRKHGKFIKKIVEELVPPRLDPVEISEMYLVESILQKDDRPIYKKIGSIKL